MHTPSNGEQAERPWVEDGDRIRCPRCCGIHALEATASLLFYLCGQHYFLAGVDNRLAEGIEVIVNQRDAVDASHADRPMEQID